MKAKSKESKSADSLPSSSSSSSSDFSSAITTTAVAQICQTAGFRAAQTSALETLTAVAARYLQSLGSAAASSAASAGRTESNLLDIVVALEDLHCVQGFNGASNVNRSLLSSLILNDIMRFVYYNVEIPFAKPIPRRDKPSISSESGCLESPGFNPLSVNSVSIYSPRASSMGPHLSEGVKRDSDCGSSSQKLKLLTNPRGNCGLVNNKSVILGHIPRWLPEIPVMGDGEGSGEEKWGFGEGSEGCLVGEKMGVEKEKERGGDMELPVKRGKMRFKMGVGVGVGGERFGVDLRSGVCRGGKRVSCQIWSVNGEDKNVRSKR